MKGHQHYSEAERCISAALSDELRNEEGYTGWARDELAALAQVHATLALAAATSEAHPRGPWEAAK